MTHLERRASTSGTVGDLAGEQQRVSGYFGPSVDLWEDFTVLPHTPGAVASALCGKRTVRVAGTYRQKVTAWSASLDQVLVVELVRDLEPAGDRKMRPTSPWRVDAQVMFGSSSAPRLRRGSVANDYGTSGEDGRDPSAPGAKDPYTGSSDFRWGSRLESSGDEEHAEAVVGQVAVAAGQAAVELDDAVESPMYVKPRMSLR